MAEIFPDCREYCEPDAGCPARSRRCFYDRGQLTMGDYVAFSGLIWAIANPMRQMGNIMNEFQRFSAASKKVMELYYSEPKIRDEEMPFPIRSGLKAKSSLITFPSNTRMVICRFYNISSPIRTRRLRSWARPAAARHR